MWRSARRRLLLNVVKYVSLATGKLKSPFPPRPPNSNSLKWTLVMENFVEDSVLGGSVSGVKV